MAFSDSPQPPEPVPEIPADEFVTWVYSGQPVQIAGPAHDSRPLPAADRFLSLVEYALEEGYTWMLLDGPRRVRASWLLDPRWHEQPSMSPRLQQITQARCVRLSHLAAALKAINCS